MATNINLGEVHVANVDRFQVTIKKDGSVWDLSSGTVTMTFENPDRTTQSAAKTMTANTDGTDGVFYYDSETTDFTDEGRWTATVKVVDGTITKEYPGEISFRVTDQP